jgi:hypothetical protein
MNERRRRMNMWERNKDEMRGRNKKIKRIGK